MNDGLLGLERDVVLNTLVQDKTPLTIAPLVKEGVSVDSMTLQSSEYKIYPQGFLFFKRFLHQWKPIDDLLVSSTKVSVRMTISFYHKGRGMYFICGLSRVQNGYALIIPMQVHKMIDSPKATLDEISAKIFFDGFSGTFIKCEQLDFFPLFENKLWLNFSKKDFDRSKDLLQKIANIEEVRLSKYCKKVVIDTKLLLYVPEKKLPKWNFFPYPVTVTEDHVDFLDRSSTASEIEGCVHPLYIPLCDTSQGSVHTILGVKPKILLLTPSDVLDSLHLLSVCRFLTTKVGNTFTAKEMNNLHIIFLSENTIILGRHETKNSRIFPLSIGQEYSLQLFIPTETLVRTIRVQIAVKNVHKNKMKATCAVCNFLHLQEEDRRYLHEKYYNSRLR